MDTAARLESRWGRIILINGYLDRFQNVEFGAGLSVAENIAVQVNGGEPENLSLKHLRSFKDGESRWQLKEVEVERRVKIIEPEKRITRAVEFAVEIVCRNRTEGKKDIKLTWSVAPDEAKVALLSRKQLWGKRHGSELAGQEIYILIDGYRQFFITEAGRVIPPLEVEYPPGEGRLNLTYNFPLWKKGSEEKILIKGLFQLKPELVFSRSAFLVAKDSWEGGVVAASAIAAREMTQERLSSTKLTYLEQIQRYPHQRYRFARIYTPLFWFEDAIPPSVIETLMSFPDSLDAIFLIGEVRPISYLKQLLSLIWQMRGPESALYIFTADPAYLRQVEDFKDQFKLEIGLQAGDVRRIQEADIIRAHRVENLALDVRRILEEEFLRKKLPGEQIVIIPKGATPEAIGHTIRLSVPAAQLAKYLVAPLLPLGERLSPEEKDYLTRGKFKKAIIIGEKEELRRLRDSLEEAGLRLSYQEISGYDEYEVAQEVALLLLGYRLVDLVLWEVQDSEEHLPPPFWTRALDELAASDQDFAEVKEAFDRLCPLLAEDKAETRDISDFYASLTDERRLLSTLPRKLASPAVSKEVRAEYNEFCKEEGLTDLAILSDISIEEGPTDFNTALTAATYACANGASLILTRTLDQRNLERITKLLDDLISDFELSETYDFEREFRQDLFGLGEAIYFVMPRPSRELFYFIEPEHIILAPSQANAEVPYELMYDREKGRFLGLHHSFGRFSALSREDTASLMALAAGRGEIPSGEGLAPMIIYNPTQDLPSAEVEGRLVHELFREFGLSDEQISIFGRFDARERACLQRASEVSILHYAGHGDFDPIMPLTSRLLLADQDLTAMDILHRFHFSRLPIVFANACISGRVGTTHGLPYSFLRAGASNYVGSLWPVGDVQALVFAVVFYAKLLSGYPIGEAVRAGKLAGYILEEKKMADFTWASFLLYGDPTFTLTVEREQELCAKLIRAGLERACHELATSEKQEESFINELRAQIEPIIAKVAG
ncbi:MAG: CHAT domain-containing protein [Anaerolineae bacterium]